MRENFFSLYFTLQISDLHSTNLFYMKIFTGHVQLTFKIYVLTSGGILFVTLFSVTTNCSLLICVFLI